jgi:hypothetical protein
MSENLITDTHGIELIREVRTTKNLNVYEFLIISKSSKHKYFKMHQNT